jgi:uridine kinase
MSDKSNFFHNAEQMVGTLAIYFTTIAFFVFATRGNIFNPNNNHLPQNMANIPKEAHNDFIDEALYTSEIPGTPPRMDRAHSQDDGKGNIFLSPMTSSTQNIEPIVSRISKTHGIIVIGIAGGSGSGKTTLSEAIYQAIGKENICYISHDSYYRDLSHLSMKQRENFNFDHPDALESDLLIKHLKALKNHQDVEIPMYDFSIHSRKAETQLLHPRPVILLEGILIFTNKHLIDEIDIKIFVDTEDDIRLVRRIKRDTSERGRSIESVLTQYITTVRPMHLQFVEPSKRNADIIVPVGLNSVALDLVVSKVKHHLHLSNNDPDNGASRDEHDNEEDKKNKIKKTKKTQMK